MRTYQDTDVEIHNLVSCNVCGNWHWSKLRSMFICDGCKELRKQQVRDYKNNRNRLHSKKPTQESMRKAAAIYKIVCDHSETGVTQNHIREHMIHNGWKIKSQSIDVLGLLDYTGHLVWLDDNGLLHPYKNTNTGEVYK